MSADAAALLQEATLAVLPCFAQHAVSSRLHCSASWGVASTGNSSLDNTVTSVTSLGRGSPCTTTMFPGGISEDGTTEDFKLFGGVDLDLDLELKEEEEEGMEKE